MSYLKIPPFYRNPDGTRPTQGGKFVFVSEHEFHVCCCGFGCHCYWIYEWDCDSNGWVLVDSGMSDGIESFYTVRGPYDQWNYFYAVKDIPRSSTVIRATYGTWIDCDSGSCSDPGTPAAPNEVIRAWKCDSPQPDEPADDGAVCQDEWIYIYDCCEGEWLEAIRNRTIAARFPQGFAIQDPQMPNRFIVYGEHYPCYGLVSNIPGEPGPPSPPDCTTMDEYSVSNISILITYYSGSGCTGDVYYQRDFRVSGTHVLVREGGGCFWIKRDVQLEFREWTTSASDPGSWSDWTTLYDNAYISIRRCDNCGAANELPEWYGRVSYVSSGQQRTFSFYLNPITVEPIGNYPEASNRYSSGRRFNGECAFTDPNSQIMTFSFSVS